MIVAISAHGRDVRGILEDNYVVWPMEFASYRGIQMRRGLELSATEASVILWIPLSTVR